MSDLTEFPDLSGEQTGAPEPEPVSMSSRLLRALLWGGLFLALLVFFTLLKLPQDRVRNYVQGAIASALSQQDIGFTAGSSSFTLLFGPGPSYTMRKITLTFPPPQDPIKIDEVSVTPSLLGLLTGKAGGTFKVKNNGGTLKGSYFQPLSLKSSHLSADFTADRMDLGALGLLPALANLKGSAVLSGSGTIDGDATVPSTLNGEVQVTLSRIVIDSQSVLGFNLPRLSVSEGTVDVTLGRGKATFRSLKLGRTPADDIRATVTGDVTLGRSWPTSSISARADFSLSPAVMKAFPLIDALLNQGKQADGSYAFRLTGPVTAINPEPVGSGGH